MNIMEKPEFNSKISGVRGDEGESWWNPELSPDEFRQLGYRVIDMIADYYKSINDFPVFPGRPSEEVARMFDEPLPKEGQDAGQILNEWTERILPNATHVGSARYFGFVMGSGTMIATLADALASSINMNAGGWKAGPAATEIERRTICWIAEMIGYPTSCGGLFTSGGTMANFTALLTALRNSTTYDSTADGLQSDKGSGRYFIYMADHEGHVSITRVADMLNLGRNAVRLVPSRTDLTMDPAALDHMIKQDRSQGDVPFCVVAQVGSINTGGIDPIQEIADVCNENNIWFHADGACGAFGRILTEKEQQYQGLERADSVTLDPHKWLFIPYECGCVLIQNPEKLRRTFSMTAPYLRGEIPTEYTGQDYFEYGPQMSRGFRALKVWMSIKFYGLEGYRKLLSQTVHCANRLDELVRESDNFEVMHDPNLFIYSFRYAPARYRKGRRKAGDDVEEYFDWLNQRIAEEIQASGIAFIMTSKVRGHIVLRLSICSHRTTIKDIKSSFQKLAEIGESIVAEEMDSSRMSS
jgi:glutamate/tyrosine decarboxylase-like PLP-dependent enzyme